jgi:hypothetical protein
MSFQPEVPKGPPAGIYHNMQHQLHQHNPHRMILKESCLSQEVCPSEEQIPLVFTRQLEWLLHSIDIYSDDV